MLLQVTRLLVNTAQLSKLLTGKLPLSSVHLLVLLYLRLISQDRVEQRTVNFDVAVVADEAFSPEFVHEKTYPRSGSADHFRERFLTEGHRDRSCAFLPEIRKKQE